MAPRKQPAKPKQQKVRKTLMVDADKLARARQLLHMSSDADVLRLALDLLLSRHVRAAREEE